MGGISSRIEACMNGNGLKQEMAAIDDAELKMAVACRIDWR